MAPRSSILLLLALFCPVARAESNGFTVTSRSDGAGIAGLELTADSDSLIVDTSVTPPRARARLRGRLGSPGKVVIYGNDEVTTAEQSEFELVVPVDRPVTSVRLRTVDPAGEISRAEYAVSFPGGWEELQSVLRANLPSPPVREAPLRVGLTAGVFSYSDLRVGDFSESAITAWATATMALPDPRWELESRGTFTLLPVGGTYPVTARFLNLSGSVAWNPPWLRGAWSMSLTAGAFYATMMVKPAVLGYRDLIGPRFTSTLRRALKGGSSLSASVRVAPIINDLSAFNRELALGLDYTVATGAAHPIGLGFEASSLSLQLGDRVGSSTAMSIGVSYGL